jgi:two-component system, response regulator PdtaR
MKILIIDDEPLVRLSLRRALQKSGHTLEEAEDGQTGFEKWTVFQPDLVFLDVLMPRLSGPDLLKKISPSQKGRAKVILMSAFTGEYDLEKAKSLGADLFIPKPFEDIFAVTRQGEDVVRG